jgi:hypothetical protein
MTDKKFAGIRMKPEIYKMLAILAAMNRKPMGDFLEEVLTPLYRETLINAGETAKAEGKANE